MKISIGIPVYNAEKYIEKCLKSLFEQSYEDLEYIFVDDGSTDRSVEVIQEIASRYPNRKEQIKIVKHTQNRGSAASRNDCIDNASGEWMGWCDSDDWVEPRMYEKLLTAALKDSSDLVYCNYVYENTDHSTIKSFLKATTGKEITKLAILGQKVPLVLWSGIAKTSLYREHNIRCKEGYNVAEDYLVQVSLYCVSKRVSMIEEPLYHYRNNPNSMGGVKNKKALIYPLYKQLYENVGAGLSFVRSHDGESEMKDYLIWAELLRNTQLLYNFCDPAAWRKYSKPYYSHISSNPAYSKKEKLIEKCLSHGFCLPFYIKYLVLRYRKGKYPLKNNA